MKKERKKAIKKFVNAETRMWMFTTLAEDTGDDSFEARLHFDSYSDLMYTVSDLMKISMHALYHDGDTNSGEIAEPGYHVISVLRIASQLLPLNESEVLDNCHRLYLKLEELKNSKS